ncbi:M48 family metalloprotease [Actinomadura luteofluorescens]|uniref:M48 family metalloprotease n=1 Tax=Actinomadura luteofluorescens TaxID=46163 RepID=UPI002164C598|nr:M48 family metalloprotease [Actinomadura glauciflava]MCR3743971.1 Zn-dependent protease with chaperone function [Actinomadura glauciflava]
MTAAHGRSGSRRSRRTIDGASLSRLLFGLPWFLTSLVVVLLVGAIAGAVAAPLGPLVVLGWLGSGAVVFWGRAESWFARSLLRCRPPTEDERDRLAPIWDEVTRRAGVDGSRYSLWIEPAAEMNAQAGAGHIVAITDWTLRTQQPRSLAAILAHELGHHMGGHAWSTLVVLWYSLPGRVAVRATRAVVRFALHMIRAFSALGWSLAIVVLIFIGFGLVLAAPYLVLLPALPYAAAYASRAAELRADRFAARLGYGEDLLQTLRTLREVESGAPQENRIAGYLATHPPAAERVRAVEFFLGCAWRRDEFGTETKRS